MGAPGADDKVRFRRERADTLSVSIPTLVLGLGVALAVPLLVAAIRLAGAGWSPTADNSILATRSYDVLSARSPLIGPNSMAAGPGTETAHSLGPLLYWLLAVPARYGPTWGLPVFMALVNSALLVLVLVLARRRGGLGLAVVTAVGLAFLVRSIGPLVLSDIWNPHASLMPFLALVFLTWSVADGERQLLPGVVLAASFVMQSHLTYVMPSLALIVVALAGGWGADARAWVRRRAGRRPDPGPAGVTGLIGPDAPADAHSAPLASATAASDQDDTEEPPTAFASPAMTRRRGPSPLLLAAVVGVACWIVPVIQQITGDPGNMGVVRRAAGSSDQQAGLDGFKAGLARSVGIPPRWMRPQADSVDDLLEGLQPPGGLWLLSALAVLAVLLVTVLLARRRRDRLVLAGGATSLALLAAMAWVSLSLPLDRGLIAGYSFLWFRIAGFFVWLVAGLGVVRAVTARVSATQDARPEVVIDPTHPAPPVANAHGNLVTIAVGALGVAILVLGLLVPRPDPIAWTYEPADRLGDALEASTEKGDEYLIAPTVFDVSLSPAMAWRLRTTGRLPIVRDSRVSAWGDEYGASGDRCAGVVYLQKPDAPRPSGARTLAVVELDPIPGQPDQVRLDLAPDRSPRGLC